jgi:hypothetical protein
VDITILSTHGSGGGLMGTVATAGAATLRMNKILSPLAQTLATDRRGARPAVNDTYYRDCDMASSDWLSGRQRGPKASR